MDEKTLKLLVDLHIGNKRQGPGSDEIVRKILGILNLDKNSKLEIVDIGCGTGASSIEILKNTNANITAVDFLPEFLEKLKKKAKDLNCADSQDGEPSRIYPPQDIPSQSLGEHSSQCLGERV